MAFPERFAWGAATSSYQIEGAVAADGKGPSVWDMFARKPDVIWQGQSGDVACDHYARAGEDVTLMQRIGLRAYRFSVSWPRVLPDGTGAVNAAGLAFYDRLVDALLEADVTPYVTLFHWDYPLALYHRGGWLNRDSVQWFGDYTEAVVRALSDRVRHFMTHNEIQVFVTCGHWQGVHAPGDRLEFRQVLRVGHHALLAHGRSVQAIRANAKGPVQIGYAPAGVVHCPVSERPQDVDAARAAMFAVGPRQPWNNAWWMDPVLLGGYPEAGLQAFGSDAPDVTSGDYELMRQPIDFLGINIYQGRLIRAAADGTPREVSRPIGHPLTGFDWPVTPDALYWGPRLLHERYGLPIVITENGCSTRDWPSLDGRVHDPQRIDFVTRYLRELHRAIQEGVPVHGYFLWSLLDNFEWAEGYKERFGLVHVDYPTQGRTLKDSALWYREVIASNGAAALE